MKSREENMREDLKVVGAFCLFAGTVLLCVSTYKIFAGEDFLMGGLAGLGLCGLGSRLFRS
jgi:hypothetical protein